MRGPPKYSGVLMGVPMSASICLTLRARTQGTFLLTGAVFLSRDLLCFACFRLVLPVRRSAILVFNILLFDLHHLDHPL